MILVLVIERVKNWRVRKSENERYEIKKKEEVEAVEEKINGQQKYSISTKNLVKVYRGKVEAVKGIEFQVGENQIVGLLGPNGAGKSSTFNMITLQQRRTCGKLEILGKDIEQVTSFKVNNGLAITA